MLHAVPGNYHQTTPPISSHTTNCRIKDLEIFYRNTTDKMASLFALIKNSNHFLLSPDKKELVFIIKIKYVLFFGKAVKTSKDK